MLAITLLLLAAAPDDDDGPPSFSETASPSTITVLGSGATITNVTWDFMRLDRKGVSTNAVLRRTEKYTPELGIGERNRQFIVDVWFDYEKKPSLRFTASGEELLILDDFYAARTAMGLENTWELFDLDTQKRFLVAAENYERISIPGEDQFLGYEKLEKEPKKHGRLVLTTRKGVKSEVTFTQKDKGTAKVLHWAPKIETSPKQLRLTFYGEHVVDVPITNGKLNGKDQSVIELP